MQAFSVTCTQGLSGEDPLVPRRDVEKGPLLYAYVFAPCAGCSADDARNFRREVSALDRFSTIGKGLKIEEGSEEDPGMNVFQWRSVHLPRETSYFELPSGGGTWSGGAGGSLA